MSRRGWDRFALLIEEYGIQPILAVVPDNKDCQLMVSPDDPEFWRPVQSLESAGATIAMHGYQHLCEGRGKSILGLHGETEFAGIAMDVQRQWIRRGLEILRGHELNPRPWVAPRHGFDASTLAGCVASSAGERDDANLPAMFDKRYGQQDHLALCAGDSIQSGNHECDVIHGCRASIVSSINFS